MTRLTPRQRLAVALVGGALLAFLGERAAVILAAVLAAGALYYLLEGHTRRTP